jgi:gamma-tubulin complex component 5
MPVYQQFHTLLLQTYRAKYLLQRARPTRSHKPLSSATLILRLGHRLTWFVDILRSYYTETVVTFTTADMASAMRKAEDIDQMADIHVRYVARLQERALLSADLRPIHKAVVEVLDMCVLFAKTVGQLGGRETDPTRPSAARRKSSALLLNQEQDSDTDDEKGEEGPGDDARSTRRSAHRSPEEALRMVDKEFARLLPFITAGLRSVGRVGAEPMWEQLAERLEWEAPARGQRDRY